MKSAPTPGTRAIRSATVIKAVISIALIGWLATRVDVSPLLSRFAAMDMTAALAAVAVMFGQLVLTAWRWRLVADRIGGPLPPGPALRLTLIGQFFSQTLPSAIGGDGVRAWLASRLGISLPKAIAGMFADRVAALIVLVGFVGAMLPWLHARIGDVRLVAAAALLVAATMAAAAILIGLGDKIGVLLGRSRWTRPVAEPATALRTVLRGPGSLQIVALSALVHLGVILGAFLIARSLRIGVDFVDCLVLIPPIVLLTTLPVSIAGWGVREGAAVVGFGLIGTDAADALAISVAFGLVQIVIGLPGGLLWLMDGRPGRPLGKS